MEKNVFVKNPGELDRIKKRISERGAEKLHVISDFDKTLTRAFVGGKPVHSLIAVLRDGDYVSDDYARKAHALFDKYHPIEIDPEIPFKEKKQAMHEWWSKHFKLLMESGLNKKHFDMIIDSGKIRLRQGFEEFAEFLNLHRIPLVILSASGVDGSVIENYLKKEKLLSENMHIVANRYVFDEKGDAVAVKEPTIHSLNKDETVVDDMPFFDLIKDRKNVLLLGDNIGDVKMIRGFDCENLIKIGFLNSDVEQRLEDYADKYDVVLLNDASMDYINQLLKEIA